MFLSNMQLYLKQIILTSYFSNLIQELEMNLESAGNCSNQNYHKQFKYLYLGSCCILITLLNLSNSLHIVRFSLSILAASPEQRSDSCCFSTRMPLKLGESNQNDCFSFSILLILIAIGSPEKLPECLHS